ncbi:MAG TPA: hypothetical protein DCX34_18640 [Roseovarius sp.]|nr:hypothetical protein [Roseovarius sp.]
MTEETFKELGRSWGQGISIGICVAVLTAVVSILANRSGMAPFPQPPALAFAETLAGRELPMPVGLLFHTVYVTGWSALFLRYSPWQGAGAIAVLSLLLWGGVLLVFFPIVGWGLFGLGIGPQMIPGSFVPHFLFGLFLWGLDRVWPR